MKSKLRKSKSKSTKRELLLTRWQLIRNTWREFRSHRGRYLLTAGVVLLPSSVIRAYVSSQKNAADYTIALYVAGLFCILALFWLAQRRAGEKPSVRDLYVASSRRILPYLWISILVALCLVPLLVGATVIVLALGLGSGLWLLSFGAALGVLSLFLMIRLGFALVAGVDERLRWRSAFAQAWRISRKRWWYLFWSWLIYFLIFGTLSGVILDLARAIPNIGSNIYFSSIVSGLMLIVTVPLLVIYATYIYENLGGNYGRAD